MFDFVVVFVETGLLRRPVARERQSDRGSVQIRGRAMLGGAFPKAETPLRRRFRRRARRTAPTFHIRFGRPTSVRAEEMGAAEMGPEAGVRNRADGARLLSSFWPSDGREAEEMGAEGGLGKRAETLIMGGNPPGVFRLCFVRTTGVGVLLKLSLVSVGHVQ